MLRKITLEFVEGGLVVSKFLVTFKSETKEILAQILQTNPSQIPVMLLQIQFERLMLQVVDLLRKDLEASIRQLEGTIYENK